MTTIAEIIQECHRRENILPNEGFEEIAEMLSKLEAQTDAEPACHVLGIYADTCDEISVALPKGTKLYTHPPTPKAITADDVTETMVDKVEELAGMGHGAWDMVYPKEIIAAAVNAFNGVKP